MKDSLFETRLNRLIHDRFTGALSEIQIGLERETLRVDEQGFPSDKPHPEKLGSALTHPSITTDYAESLLEFVTSPAGSVEAASKQLQMLMRFAARNIGDEILWCASMPCQFDYEHPLRIAEYGKSNIGLWKHLYRIGLAYRYGKAMQMIAGIHFNFSFKDESWVALGAMDEKKSVDQNYISARYLDMARNIQRTRFVIPFLFGVSPAVGRSFFFDSTDQLPQLGEKTRFLPFGTTLRLSNVGYSNRRCGAYAPLNSLDDYLNALKLALKTKCPSFEAIGVKVEGQYRQLNTNILQIENEYYASVRPKQPPRENETAFEALQKRGIAYVEMRLLDVSPFDPLGADLDTLRFIQAWMTVCFLKNSPPISLNENYYSDMNLMGVAMDGRQTDLRITNAGGHRVPLKDALSRLLDETEAVSELLGQPFVDSVKKQRAKLEDSTLLPSHRVLQELRAYEKSFQDFGMSYAKKHSEALASAEMNPACVEKLTKLAADSLKKQKEIEAADTLSFEEYLKEHAG